jgi:hypothetical protein
MSLQRTLDILNDHSGLGHFYIEYGKNATKFYPWKNDSETPEFSDLIAAIEGVPFKSDDKYTFVDLFNILFDKHSGWELAKLYFCAKKEPSSSLLKLLPLGVFKEIFHLVYPRERMNIFLEILSDIHLFVSCTRPIYLDTYPIYAMLDDEDIRDKYKVVLARNIKNLSIQSNCNERVKYYFQYDLSICETILIKNKKTGEYEYSNSKPIKEENSKKKQKKK